MERHGTGHHGTGYDGTGDGTGHRSTAHRGSEDRRAERRGSDPELRARLTAAGSLLGVRIAVTDDAEWAADETGVRVGLGFYAAQGHGPDEAIALALLDLWTSVRDPRAAPLRRRRRIALAARRPELEPLLAAVDRLQAAGELLATMPAIRGHLALAAVRRVPAELRQWPRHLQWIGALLRRSLSPGAEILSDDAVTAELRRLDELGGDSADALRRVTAPDPARTPLHRLERALALLMPPYLRLLALDAAERGIAEGGADAPEADGADPGSELSADLAGGGAGDESAAEGEGEAGPEAESAPPDPDAQSARAGDRRDTSEGADLFAAEQAGFVSAVLPTPLPAQSLVDALPDLPVESGGSADLRPGEFSGPGTGAASVAMSAYRDRVSRHAPDIERMREVWQRIIAERVAPRPVLARRPEPEGETLDTETLASTVAQVVSGVRRPDAFRRRAARLRRTRRAGSTDYVLLVDRSASMQGLPAEAAADAALVMLEALAGVERDIAEAELASGVELDLEIRTALIVFDASAVVVKPLAGALDDASRRALHAEVRSPRGSTNDGAALRAAAEQLGVVAGPGSDPLAAPARDGVERRRIVVLVSDGGSNDPVATAAELRRLRAAGVTVFGIGVGGDEVVHRFAPGSTRVDDPRRLPEVLGELIERELPV
ncbi:VWA domain-containing protein [Leucobacter sp. CSA1]|uniref:VWA domain-containing protein n=1 Tax=Leucobacter chromiisoli TaxID=2796471 RepID=A0A934UTA1_9MICO|nr:vWA domain-containing protein [Leucobacter chromiisoli]MBK0418159.1 VWA domain-containing protein [Leucobacter chromiisoli]